MATTRPAPNAPSRRGFAAALLGGVLRAGLVALLAASTSCGACSGDGARPADDRTDDYLAVAFGNRFGPPPDRLHKWSQGALVLRPTGEPTYEDRVHLRLLVRELDATLEHLDLVLAEWDERPADVEIRFEPLAEFAAGGYPARFDCPADDAGRLQPGVLHLPAGDDVPQYMRFNLLVEGLAACLGLAGTSGADPESAFYAAPNWYEEGFTPGDLALFALHDRPELTPGLSRAEAQARLDG